MSTIKDILKTESIKHFNFSEVFTLRDGSASVALDHNNHNVIVFNVEDENILTIYGGETPYAVEALFSVKHASESYQSVISGEYDLDLDDPEDKIHYEELIAKYSGRLSRTTQTYTASAQNLKALGTITLQDDEDLDSIDIDASNINELCTLMLRCHQERVVKIAQEQEIRKQAAT